MNSYHFFLFDVTGPWFGPTTSSTTLSTFSLMLMQGSDRLTPETVSLSTSPGSDCCGAGPSSLHVDGEVVTGIGHCKEVGLDATGR